jgi:hypothetical protein
MKATGAQERGRVEIRVRNVSDLDFDSVRAYFPEGEVDYGPVSKGAVSAFRPTGRAYRYAGFSVKSGNRELSLRPIDYMGEQELTEGRYTYALDVDDGVLTVRLQEAN